MEKKEARDLFNLSGKTAVVIGGAGVLCSAMSKALSEMGVSVAILDINQAAAESLAAEIKRQGGKAIGLHCDVLDKKSLEAAADLIRAELGEVDFLLNGAGGNHPKATTNDELSFFDIPRDALNWVVDLNLMGTILPCQVFGKLMADQKSGVIINISSMNAMRPLTRIAAYSAAKAGVSNFTQWLAVHMAQEYSPGIRVNAIAPGFFLTEQNRYLLTNKESGGLTQRGKTIIEHTPMGRFGVPEDLLGTIFWLLSPASSFVTGIIIPVDGGFSAYSGV